MKIVITGGGTGGHLYPALVIAERLITEGNDVVFFGNSSYLEKTECEKRGIKFIGIPSKSTLKKDIGFVVENIKGILKSLRVLKKIKPDVVYSTGGFTVAPVLAAASYLKIPCILHEQNAVVGLVHRLFRKGAAKFIHSFPFDVHTSEIFLGNLSRFKGPLKREGEEILFMGGSGGAKTVNELAVRYASDNPTKNVTLVSGRNYGLESNSPNLKILPFVEDILSVLKEADIVIARAGSTSLSELSCLGIPSIIIPMPNSADNHQEKNAQYYEKKNAIIKISQDEYTYHTLINTINKLSTIDKEQLGRNFMECYNSNVEKEVVEIIMSYTNTNLK